MYTLQAIRKDGMYIAGLSFILISLLIFCYPYFWGYADKDAMSLFFVNFAFTVIYAIILFASRRKGSQLRSLVLILFLISAYSLNREMGVFDTSAPWFAVALVLICSCFILFSIFDTLPAWLQYVQCFTLGISFVVFAYLSIYLIPLYAISAIASVILGFSLHAFVPVFFGMHAIAIMRFVTGNAKKLWRFFWAGAAVAVTFAVVFAICWIHYVNKINAFYKKDTLAGNPLPAWVSAAADIPVNPFTERILETDLVYHIPNVARLNFFGAPVRNFGAQLHDPLIVTASLFSPTLAVPEDERIKILESMFDKRHQGQERLWSGDNLTTELVEGNVQLWPQHRISYTELIVTVFHQKEEQSWRSNQEEAIYTFHLPEGGVVTSLSLWIDGKEEKGILTTKAKAQAAYAHIVGVESRDPSVVHWQEGNTVTVRVFPVEDGESRKFKIGITAPMTLRDKQLTYENIGFEGPPTANATQRITIHSDGKSYERRGAYQPEWGFSLPEQELTPAFFSFDGSTYSILPYKKESIPFSAAAVYLDVNASWSLAELQHVYKLVKDKQVFVAGNRTLDEHNLRTLYKELSQHSFSLFPFYEIKDDAGSLVITKNQAISPSLADLQSSPFMDSLQVYFTGGHRLKVFDLGRHLSPYLKSLKEFRTFQYAQGDMQELERLLTTHTYLVGKEDDNLVNIDNAQLSIKRSQGNAAVQGPDHIMRLFSYNHILQCSGTGLLEGAVLQPDLIAEAEKGVRGYASIQPGGAGNQGGL